MKITLTVRPAPSSLNGPLLVKQLAAQGVVVDPADITLMPDGLTLLYQADKPDAELEEVTRDVVEAHAPPVPETDLQRTIRLTKEAALQAGKGGDVYLMAGLALGLLVAQSGAQTRSYVNFCLESLAKLGIDTSAFPPLVNYGSIEEILAAFAAQLDALKAAAGKSNSLPLGQIPEVGKQKPKAKPKPRTITKQVAPKKKGGEYEQEQKV